MSSKKTISRQMRTTFRRLNFTHYPNRRVRRERHTHWINKRKMRTASRPTMRTMIFNIKLGPFQNQSRTRHTVSMEIILLPWRTSPVLAASLPKPSSNL